MIINLNIIEDKLYYKGKEYNEEEIKRFFKSIKIKLNISIISSNLFIKKYDLLMNNNYENFIEEKINSDFHEKDKFLFHYEKLKKEKKIYLYAIRSDKFKFIYKDIKNIEIIPIQFIIKNYIIRKYKKYNKILIIYIFKERYNLLNIKNRKIEDYIVYDNISNVNSYLKENKEKFFVIIDKSLENMKLQEVNCEINLKEEIYDKIYKI